MGYRVPSPEEYVALRGSCEEACVFLTGQFVKRGVDCICLVEPFPARIGDGGAVCVGLHFFSTSDSGRHIVYACRQDDGRWKCWGKRKVWLCATLHDVVDYVSTVSTCGARPGGESLYGGLSGDTVMGRLVAEVARHPFVEQVMACPGVKRQVAVVSVTGTVCVVDEMFGAVVYLSMRDFLNEFCALVDDMGAGSELSFRVPESAARVPEEFAEIVVSQWRAELGL